jgi:hypothetical protein
VRALVLKKTVVAHCHIPDEGRHDDVRKQEKALLITIIIVIIIVDLHDLLEYQEVLGSSKQYCTCTCWSEYSFALSSLMMMMMIVMYVCC